MFAAIGALTASGVSARAAGELRRIPAGAVEAPTAPFKRAGGPFGIDVIRPPGRLRCALELGGPVAPSLAVGARGAARGPRIARIDISVRAPDGSAAGALAIGALELRASSHGHRRFYQVPLALGWPGHSPRQMCQRGWTLRYRVHTVGGHVSWRNFRFRLLPARLTRPGCRHDGRTLAAGRESRVFALDDRIYGCSRKLGHNWRLTDAGEFGDGPPHHVTVTGRYAAFDKTFSAAAQGSRQILVFELRAGDARSWMPASGADPSANQYGEVFALVLTRTGTVAWMSRPARPDATRYELHVAPFHGQDTVVDAAADIDPRSLRRSGTIIMWSRAGQTRTTTVR